MNLTAPSATEIKTFFDDHGYYLAKNAFPPGDVAELEEQFDRIVGQLTGTKENINARWGGAAMERMGAASTTVFHTHNVQTYSARWLRALQQPEFLDPAAEILGPDIILHHSKLFQKPQGTGAPFPMHQDWQYFPTEKDSMIAGVIHVSDATDEMGCFRVYPGSHRLGRVTGMTGMEKEEHIDLRTKYPLESATAVEAAAGDVLFFHYCLLHGSAQNVSERVRKTVLVQLYSGRDKIEDGNNHPNARLTLRGWNHAATRANAAQS